MTALTCAFFVPLVPLFPIECLYRPSSSSSSCFCPCSSPPSCTSSASSFFHSPLFSYESASCHTNARTSWCTGQCFCSSVTCASLLSILGPCYGGGEGCGGNYFAVPASSVHLPTAFPLFLLIIHLFFFAASAGSAVGSSSGTSLQPIRFGIKADRPV